MRRILRKIALLGDKVTREVSECCRYREKKNIISKIRGMKKKGVN